ncbi:MAG TPA: poly(R)-hydroxyalkanoic acid synthase subunit PhaE [Candidatus Methanoperedens sp.]|nr:poly(R)-hydroxyalkanoic acid synthase subunit PhaE [Candidatus Methanoperedens sp.]
MAKKTEERKEVSEEKQDMFKTWADSYTEVSKMWEDSYLKLYKPWIESTEEMFEKAAQLSKESSPRQYKEFYDDWVKTYQNTFGKYYSLPTLKSNKETLEKLLTSAEESNGIYRSWITELEDNSRKTREILKGEADPAKYRECHDMWIKSYEKIFDEIMVLPVMESTKEIFEKYTGVPDIYFGSFVQMSKLWKNTYAKLYGPWSASIARLSEKMAELSAGGASPEAYKEFYTIWMETYKETYEKYFQSVQPSKEVFESFVHSTSIYLNMYKSWITALEKMSKKAEELSKKTTDPEAYKEFYDLWVKMYEKAFESFFEDMPVMGPMKELMDPVKNMAKIYTDTFARMSKMWMK